MTDATAPHEAATPAAPQPAAPPISGRGRLVSIVGGSAGNLVEWFDWFAYAAFSLYFAPHFFPTDEPLAALLGTSLVFAVGFLMRPLGAYVMGIYSDRVGRKAGLTLSVSLMCAGSLLIAVTPDYDAIGVAAPILLTLARLMQGLSVGGEYGASATYLSEMAGRRRRGFWSSFQYVTLISGQLLALGLLLLLQALMPADALAAWGWRIPFALGALLAVVVFWLRRGLAETESFRNAQQDVRAAAVPRSSAWALLRHHPAEALTVMLLTAGGTLAFYACAIYPQKFLVVTAGYSKEVATQVTALALLAFMPLQPVAGALSDRVGRKALLVGFGTLGVLGAWPFFTALEAPASPFIAWLLVFAALAAVTGYTAINAVVKAELFPAHIRALGVALPYALANAVFGGTAEAIALWFKSIGFERGFYLYVTAMIGVSLVTYLRMKDTRTASRIVED